MDHISSTAPHPRHYLPPPTPADLPPSCSGPHLGLILVSPSAPNLLTTESHLQFILSIERNTRPNLYADFPIFPSQNLLISIYN